MYGFTMRVPAPVEAYRAMHAAIVDVVGEEGVEGLLAHVAYPTAEGFAITEVWKSKDQLDAFNRTVLPRAFERLGMSGEPEGEIEEFEPTLVFIPAAFDSDRATAAGV